ncbi:hypothetical protein NPIL_367331 [Nephila pilipes]|uniref:Uncharacterized protein n=1 Tax=Nephila pilipes TaxID=299642 RepID=A0A8X6MWJ8_NEPPI|nr:hypothetical protein NPIL_367331 [Nephila pilipes]
MDDTRARRHRSSRFVLKRMVLWGQPCCTPAFMAMESVYPVLVRMVFVLPVYRAEITEMVPNGNTHMLEGRENKLMGHRAKGILLVEPGHRKVFMRTLGIIDGLVEEEVVLGAPIILSYALLKGREPGINVVPRADAGGKNRRKYFPTRI